MATVMANLKISQDKVQLAMAMKAMNPYDLCSAAGISYAYQSVESNCNHKAGEFPGILQTVQNGPSG